MQHEIRILVAELDGAGSFGFALMKTEELDERLLHQLRELNISPGEETTLDTGALFRGLPIKLIIAENREEAYRLIPTADFLITKGLPLRSEHLTSAHSLKFIQFYGQDHREVDFVAIKESGIPFDIYARLAHSAVAEQALLLMLATMRNLRSGEMVVRKAENPYELKYSRYMFNWASLPSIHLLRGSTLGIIGMGEIGIQLAHLAAALQMNIIYTQRTRHDAETEQRFSMTFHSLEEVLQLSDVISIHLPLVRETVKLISHREIGMMKPNAVLINTSRSRIVDEGALYTALTTNKLKGAGLDVFDIEPVKPGHMWEGVDNVILSPHVGGAPISCHLDDVKYAIRNCLDHL
ncbi:NAD(P)-dependent oxidoreductase [Paenibacillus wynnii]|uniref:NAD(P)-dependent oxidoreductase n=1 Tax=Paenibacillus wynnii TaxID=268407 RepID=UPI0027951E40|nr:NAD(P)-dependent oxidoreductase [Paenibacillus wynnii]MDQ0193750.1 glyoxylate reductase/D-3-phosphoglycerate dehydrogenase [Paenibacillus wynnii]